jgi:hypothetical protein
MRERERERERVRERGREREREASIPIDIIGHPLLDGIMREGCSWRKSCAHTTSKPCLKRAHYPKVPPCSSCYDIYLLLLFHIFTLKQLFATEKQLT